MKALREYSTYDAETDTMTRHSASHRARLYGCVPAVVVDVVRYGPGQSFRLAASIIYTRTPHRYARLRRDRAFVDAWKYGLTH